MTLKWLFNTVFVTNIVLVCYIEGIPENLKLELVQILYRHGDRAPNYMYPNDPNPLSVWPDGKGQLTELGKRQHYNLGKFFRTRYMNFMDSDPSEIRVISTENPRCIQSAIANLAAFYPFHEAVEFPQQKYYNQIPVFFLPAEFDELLGTSVDCPLYSQEKRKIIGEYERKFYEKYKDMYEYYSYHSGREINDWQKAKELHDPLFVEKKHNLIVPEWADKYFSQLEEIVETTYILTTNLLLRVRTGPLIRHMIENMQDKIDGESNLKFYVFSAHNINILRLSNALELKIGKVPYCATLIFELYSGGKNSNFIRILYLNSSEPEKEIESPHTLVLDGCEELCPLEHFVQFTRHLIPGNLREECKIPAYQPQNFQTGILIGAIVIFILIAVFCTNFKPLHHRLDRFQHGFFHTKV